MKATSCTAKLSIAFASVVLASIHSTHGQIVTNGSFELPDIPDNSAMVNSAVIPATTNIGGWTFFGSSGIIDAPSAHNALPPPSGDQLAFLQLGPDGGADSAWMSQAANIPAAGQYLFSFYYSTPAQSGNVRLRAPSGGSRNLAPEQPWTYYVEPVFIPAAGPYSLFFQVEGTLGTGSRVFIDDVRITPNPPVPEPASVILLASGATICFRRRRGFL